MDSGSKVRRAKTLSGGLRLLIGEHFDLLYNFASLNSPALTTVQTALVLPGGAVVSEFKLEVPGRFWLVDHALSRILNCIEKVEQRRNRYHE